jgi:hypothetical protein
MRLLAGFLLLGNYHRHGGDGGRRCGDSRRRGRFLRSPVLRCFFPLHGHSLDRSRCGWRNGSRRHCNLFFHAHRLRYHWGGRRWCGRFLGRLLDDDLLLDRLFGGGCRLGRFRRRYHWSLGPRGCRRLANYRLHRGLGLLPDRQLASGSGDK